MKQRHAHAHVKAVFQQGTDVGENLLVVHAGPLLVLDRVHLLDVEQEQVHVARDIKNRLGLGVAACLDRRVVAAVLAGRKQGAGGLGLCQDLTAAQGHAAAGHTVEVRILVHKRNQVADLAILAHDGKCLLQADLLTGTAAQALLGAVHHMLAIDELVNPCGARLDARPAVHASSLLEHDLKTTTLALGIGAPLAAQRASLEERDGANARAVVHVVLLRIEDARAALEALFQLLAHMRPPFCWGYAHLGLSGYVLRAWSASCG